MEEQSKLCLETCVCVLLGTRVCYAVCVRYCLEHNSGPKHSPLGILQENCMSETGPSLNHFPQQIFEEKAKLQQGHVLQPQCQLPML